MKYLFFLHFFKCNNLKSFNGKTSLSVWQIAQWGGNRPKSIDFNNLIMCFECKFFSVKTRQLSDWCTIWWHVVKKVNESSQRAVGTSPQKRRGFWIKTYESKKPPATFLILTARDAVTHSHLKASFLLLQQEKYLFLTSSPSEYESFKSHVWFSFQLPVKGSGATVFTSAHVRERGERGGTGKAFRSFWELPVARYYKTTKYIFLAKWIISINRIWRIHLASAPRNRR